MKITYLTASGIPSVAANTVQVMKMCQSLGRLGHDVTLWANDGEPGVDPFERYGVERVFTLERGPRVPGKAGAVVELARRTAQLWRAPAPDVYVSRVPRYLLSVAARGRPMIYEAHTVEDRFQTRAELTTIFALPNFARLVCISGALRDDMLAAYPRLSPSKVVVLHDGADPLPALEPLPLAALGGRAKAVRVGYVGGLYPGRGTEVLLTLAARLPALDFHLVGGTQADVARWKADNPPGNVHFHGHVPHAQLAAYYARFDILVAPYRERVGVFGGGGDISRWMSPLKVFEYMAAHRAIVCSDLPVLREVLRNGDNAIMLPPGDADAFAATLAQLAANRAERARLADAAHADFLAHYTWDQRAAAMVDF